jgi:type IV secretion system protein VirB4
MMMPGNSELGRRTYPLKSRNVADLMPASSVWQGADFDEQLAKTTGVRRPWLYTADPIPFRLNTDVPGGAAHTAIFGATGQGMKSTLANALCNGFLGYPKSHIISISVGKSELGSVILNGGADYVVGDRDSLAFQPLARVDDPDEALKQFEWLQLCLQSQGVPVTPERREKLGAAVRLRGADHVKRRTMTALVAHLKSLDEVAADALRVYTRAGAYGHIFDGDSTDALQWKRWTMFDLDRLRGMRPEVVAPAVSHLLHLVSSRYGLGPTLLVCDEFPAWMHIEQLESAVAGVIDTQRKNDVRALMIAQTPQQLAKYPRLMASIKSGCATRIFGRDSNAKTMGEPYGEFDVTPVELATISTLPEGSYFLKNQRGTRQFDLKLGDIGLALVNPDNRTLLAELRGQCSTADETLAAFLEHKKLAAKARGLNVWAGKRTKKVA